MIVRITMIATEQLASLLLKNIFVGTGKPWNFFSNNEIILNKNFPEYSKCLS